MKNTFVHKDTQGMILIEEAKKSSSDSENGGNFEPGSPALFDNQVIVNVQQEMFSILDNASKMMNSARDNSS